MSTQLCYSTKVDLLTEDRAQAFVDHIVKICGKNVMTYMDQNKDGTWTVEVNYDDHCSNGTAAQIIENIDGILARSNEEDKKSSRVHVEVHGERQEYWVGPTAHMEEAKSYARLLRSCLNGLTDDEAKEVLEILVRPEGK